MERKPNLVIFVADQMRADALGHLGNQAAITPNFDEICKEDGVSFRNAYCQNNVCVPSRCSFLTGWYPHTKGHRTMHYLLEKDDPMLLKTLKNQGYDVLWLGRNDIIPADRELSEYCDEYYSGYGEGKGSFLDHKDKDKKDKQSAIDDNIYSFYVGKAEEQNGFTMYDWNCVNKALEYINNLPRESEKPFCIYITLIFPHPPYICEDPWYSSIDRSKIEDIRPIPEDWSKKASMLKGIYDKQKLQGWSIEQFKELRATYHAMVSRLDHHFGMVVNALKDKGLYDDTSIFMFSDHGDYTGDYGIVEKTQNTFENPVNNIPFIIKPHKGIKVKPRISDALVELVDLCATVADMAGFEIDYTQFGKSIVPVLEGQEEHKDAVFNEGGRIHGETQAMERGHGPESPYWPRLSTQCSEGPEHTKAVMIRMGDYKYVQRLYENNELYDLKNDPMELNNIIDNPEYSQLIVKMKERILRFYMETTDFVPNRRDKR
jgi:arylsulfatase A-like enzyme